jgi:6-phosphogluconolactonase (cycloisomerase 2 family)
MVGQTPGSTSPYAIAIDPTGKYAYVGATVPGGGGVFQYTVDPAAGTLLPNPSSSNNVVSTPPFTKLGGAQPWDIKVLQISSGEYAYVSNYDDGTIWEFSVDPANGILSLLGSFLVAPTSVCTCEAGGNNIAAEDIALHPSGNYVYVTFSCCSSLQSVAQFTVNQTDGTLSPMSPPTVLSSGSAASIAVESSGKYAYVTSGDTGFARSAIAQYTIDQTTGALSLMANPTVDTGGVGPSGIVTVGK